MFRTASTKWQGAYAFPFDGFTPLYYLTYEMVDYHGPVYQEKANG